MLSQPRKMATICFTVSVADQMAVAADALGVPELCTQALSPVFFARTRTR